MSWDAAALRLYANGLLRHDHSLPSFFLFTCLLLTGPSFKTTFAQSHQLPNGVVGLVSVTLNQKDGPLCIPRLNQDAATLVCKAAGQSQQGDWKGVQTEWMGRPHLNQVGFWLGSETCSINDTQLSSCLRLRWVTGSIIQRCPYRTASVKCQASSYSGKPEKNDGQRFCKHITKWGLTLLENALPCTT